MSDIAEALLDAFHSDARLIWDAKGTSQVTARFEIGGSRVEVAFRERPGKIGRSATRLPPRGLSRPWNL